MDRVEVLGALRAWPNAAGPVGLSSLRTGDLGALQLGGGGAAEKGFLALFSASSEGGWVEHTSPLGHGQ